MLVSKILVTDSKSNTSELFPISPKFVVKLISKSTFSESKSVGLNLIFAYIILEIYVFVVDDSALLFNNVATISWYWFGCEI